MDPLHDFAATLIDVDRVEQIIQKKASILEDIFITNGVCRDRILSLTFNPIIIDFALQGSSVSFISENKLVIDYANKVAEYYDLDITCHETDFVSFCIQAKMNDDYYDIVMGLDQYFTYASSEDEQSDNLHNALSLLYTDGMLVTSLIDYKNIKHNSRIFTEPYYMRSDASEHILISNRKWSQIDRKKWIHHSYAINQTDNSVQIFDPIQRQALFFKQLAYHTQVVDWRSFAVHKNTLYKPVYSNNGQYIISIMR